MTAQKLDGVATAKAIKEELAQRVAALKEKGVTPGIASARTRRRSCMSG